MELDLDIINKKIIIKDHIFKLYDIIIIIHNLLKILFQNMMSKNENKLIIYEYLIIKIQKNYK